jgi:hypothetical protein
MSSGTAICLSCLLEAGRYADLIELLACARMKWWHWHRFGAEALARQGAWDAAIAYADGCRTPQGYDDRRIDRFCEDVLIKNGRADDAYHRYGLKAAAGPNNGTGRDLVVLKASVVEAELEKLDLKLRTVRRATRMVSPTAYEAGGAAGASLAINPGIRGT